MWESTRMIIWCRSHWDFHRSICSTLGACRPWSSPSSRRPFPCGSGSWQTLYGREDSDRCSAASCCRSRRASRGPRSVMVKNPMKHLTGKQLSHNTLTFSGESSYPRKVHRSLMTLGRSFFISSNQMILKLGLSFIFWAVCRRRFLQLTAH